MKKDQKTIGLAPKPDRIAVQLTETGAFEEKQDVARFAIAVAINEDLDPGKTPETDTRYASSSFEEIAALVSILYPDARETPFRTVEHFMNEGLIIADHKISRYEDIFSLIKDYTND